MEDRLVTHTRRFGSFELIRSLRICGLSRGEKTEQVWFIHSCVACDDNEVRERPVEVNRSSKRGHGLVRQQVDRSIPTF